MSYYTPILSKTHLWPQQVFIGLKNIEVNSLQMCDLGSNFW